MAYPSSPIDSQVLPAAPAPVPTTLKPANKRGAFSIIRAALFGPDDDQSPKKKATDPKPSIWTNLICGLRPLHLPQLDDDEEIVSAPPRPMPLPLKVHSFHDALLAPPSPGHGFVDEGMSSRYASAEDLQALDTGNEEEEEEEEGCESKGDNAIDMKAEEFIAKFYEQMRLQRSDSVDGTT